MSDPSEFIGRTICKSMFNDISWGSEDIERECNVNAHLRSYICKKIPSRRTYRTDWNNKWSNQAFYNGNIRFKERLADSSYGTQKRNIIEVMSDHSLSS